MQQQTGGDDKGNLQKIGEGLGGLMGQAADSFFGMFGNMMSNMGGWWAQTAQQQGSGGFSASFGNEQDNQCRQHFTAQAQGGARSYEDARPLYQFGHMAGQNPEYRGRSFDQIEMDLQRNWGPEQQKRYGSWPDVRGYVQFGYSGQSGQGSGGGFQASAQGSTGGASGGFQASGGTSSAPASDQASTGTGGDGSGGYRATGSVERDEDGFHASGEIDRKDF